MTPNPTGVPVFQSRKTMMSRGVTADNVLPYEKGTVTMNVEANRKVSGTTIRVIAQFHGIMTEGIFKSSDSPPGYVTVEEHRFTTSFHDGTVSQTLPRNKTAPIVAPIGVIAKGDKYCIGVEGPLEGVIAVLQRIDQRIGRPAKELLCAVIERLVSESETH
jgi:hypothetical protein